jgi:hypothetical protein
MHQEQPLSNSAYSLIEDLRRRRVRLGRFDREQSPVALIQNQTQPPKQLCSHGGLRESWLHAKATGLDQMNAEEIADEIKQVRKVRKRRKAR